MSERVHGDQPGRALDRGAERRAFLVAAAGLGLSLAVRRLGAQQSGSQQNFAPMEQDAYRPVLRPPKPNATPSMSDDDRDLLEHKIKCQCGCVLDIYTCRTTDFTCQVSPAMHRDVMRMVAGGYDATEILAAFVQSYGEVVLTAPVKQGFNWAGYFAPAIALASGAVALTIVLRKWSTQARASAVVTPPNPAGGSVPGVSDDELARLERAIREER